MLNLNKVVLELSAAVEQLDSKRASDIYYENFELISKHIEKSNIKTINVAIDYFMLVKRFNKASLLWEKLYYIFSDKIKNYRYIKMIRCLYYSGNFERARELVLDKTRQEECSEKEKAILIAIMAECGDNSYLNFLGHGLCSEDEGKFFVDRAALLHDSSFSKEADFNKSAIFVSGTPRSGTTSLGAFLNTHPDVCMTTERYGPANGYNKKMLCKEHVFFEEKYQIKYKGLYDKYDASRYFGDKRPNFLMSWELTKKNFSPSEITIVHLLRDPYLVAESYYTRALKRARGEDVWSSKNISPRDQFVACWDYNINNKILSSLVDDAEYRNSVLVIDAEELYSKEANLFSVFEFLGLEITKDVRAEACKQTEKYKTLKASRSISNNTIDLVEKNFDFLTFNKVIGYSRI